MKTDSQLKNDVEAELDWDPAINAAAIGVSAMEGVVTLTGHIDTFAEKFAAERAARRVAGVKAVAVELDVKLSPSHQRSDTEVADAARKALLWNSVAGDRVQASVEKGWLTLRGELQWEFERASAESAVRTLKGVAGISNLVTLKPGLSPSNVKAKITEALRRQVDREVGHMEVTANGGFVTRSGKVNSWHEYDAAQGAAWSTPGVTAVINELVIG
jgi:osmotically-inducible protein OsmY